MFRSNALTARSLLALLLLVLTPLAQAQPSAASVKAPAPAATPFPRVQFYAQELTYSVLLVHPTAPKTDPVAQARKLLASRYKGLNTAQTPGKVSPEALVRAIPPEEMDPIEAELLPYIARGLSAEERQKLMGARHATMLAFRLPFAQRNEVLLNATRFAHELAAEQGAFLWDSETREYFSAKGWKESRLDGWTGGPPSAPSQLTLHVYRDGEALRVISLGMAKLGLPDLVVEQVPASLSENIGRLVNSVAQLMAEGLVPSAEGVLELDLAKVKDTRVKDQLEAHTGKGAKRKAQLRALVAQRDEGDPDNALLELSFPGTGTLEARRTAVLDALFGKKEDNITRVKAGDPELEAVARKARARLAELKPRVVQGLRAPEQLLIKAGFRTDEGGTEFMWMEVTAWEKERWRGTLANEPQSVKALRLGSSVDVAEAEVEDYLYMSPTGAREGGESSQILMRREGY
jgi:uncharacterized protein YegJ (DUF2314 family)